MDKVSYLIVGAGVSGLAFANFIESDDYLVLERDDQIGGYCKTIHQDGFVWDYSGHFFHFRHKDLEQYLVDRMPNDEVKVVLKNAQILYKHQRIDFPFQKNIHQLPQEEFIECLYDLYFHRSQAKPANFKEMVYHRFGPGIAEKFLVPYNEKLYACDLSQLDVDAMGRFFPYADLDEIIRNFRQSDNRSYNSTFTYPSGGAISYVHALAREVKPEAICLQEGLVSIDLKNKIAHTTRRSIAFDALISSAPFDRLVSMTGLSVPSQLFRYNKVLVFNLGFDRKGWSGIHWVYFPERQYCFYRIGFYDNIFDTDRMSLYVEIGYPSHATVDSDAMKQQTLQDLQQAGVITDHQLISDHRIVLDPAYVHITQESNRQVEQLRRVLATRGVYSIGRYGGWTYCSIEDNMIEARELARTFNAAVR